MIIHYCWLGKAEKSDKIKYCINSWKKICPNAEIKEWNEDNFNVYTNFYTSRAYELKKYAFVSDYMRFYILYKYGGVYLDTDVELIKDITPLLDENFMGFEGYDRVASGLIMHAEAGAPFLKEVLDYYNAIKEDETIIENVTVVSIVTELLKKHGLVSDDIMQNVAGFRIYPSEYFNPKGGEYGKDKITENTYSIHHYLASWKSPIDRKIMEYRVKYGNKKGKFIFAIRHPFLTIKKLTGKA